MLKFLLGVLAGVYLGVIHLLLGMFALFALTATDSGKELLDILFGSKEKK